MRSSPENGEADGFLLHLQQAQAVLETAGTGTEGAGQPCSLMTVWTGIPECLGGPFPSDAVPGPGRRPRSSVPFCPWIKAYSKVKLDDNTVITAKQVKALQKRNALLEEENLILKKAIAIFTPHSNKDWTPSI